MSMPNTTDKNLDSDYILERLERIGGLGHWRYEFESGWLFWSRGVYEIHGLDPSQYKPDLESAVKCYVPEDREHVQACVERAIKNGENYTFECRIQHPDNTVRTVVSQGEIELDDDGKKVAIFGTINDITELREYETRFQLAALGSTSIMWDWDIVNDEVYWTGRILELLGYNNAEEMPSNSLTFFKNLVHPDDHLKLKNAFGDHFAHRAPFHIEIRLQKNDGNYAWFSARAHAHWDSEGRATRISGSLTDVHDLKMMETKLKRSNEDLNQFASIAAHDLQQPLRAISGFLSLLKEKYHEELDDSAQTYIDHAVTSAENMSELVKDLLEYSRIETEEIHYKLCDTEELVADITRSMEHIFKSEKFTINAENLPQIVCDPLKIQRVFYNLIENAIKYRGNDDPIITVIAQQQDNADWLFKIKDNGIGIDKSKQEDVFKMFTRLHKKEDYEGTGVGLAICKKVIDLHLGQIWIESKAGQGTTFAFIIPQPLNQQF